MEGTSYESSTVSFYSLSSKATSIEVYFSIRVEQDLSYAVSFLGSAVNIERFTANNNLPSTITSGTIK